MHILLRLREVFVMTAAIFLRAGLLAGMLTLVHGQNCFDPFLIFPERLDEPDVPVGAPPEEAASVDLIDFSHAVLDGCTDIELTGKTACHVYHQPYAPTQSNATLEVYSIAFLAACARFIIQWNFSFFLSLSFP